MTSKASRREFLKRASALSVAGPAAPLALNMAAVSEASAAVATDYKAIVCLFMAGGNDYANTVVPYDIDSHHKYKSLRPALGFKREDLESTLLAPAERFQLPGGRQYALAPYLKPLSDLFTSKKLAVLLNVGTLIQPTSKLEYRNNTVALPPKLFSHNDQQSFWQSCQAEGATHGWGGLMGDIFAQSLNSKSDFTCINPAGNVVFLSGKQVSGYRLSPAGAVPIKALQSLTPLAGSHACSALLRDLVTDNRRGNLFRRARNDAVRESIEAQSLFSQGLAPVPSPLLSGGIENPLESQLNMVARSIAASSQLGARRQVFFVSMGGFDTHNGLGDTHPQLMTVVGNAISKFYQTTVELGVAHKVTTFTASDFGRSWGNDDGSDHGWGSMHFVVGGAVQGQRFFGSAPEIMYSTNSNILRQGGENDIGNGRLLPTTSVDQMAGTLGRWMGLSDGQIRDILPNVMNWGDKRYLGFLPI